MCIRGFHVREDVAPLKYVLLGAVVAEHDGFHVREDVAPLKFPSGILKYNNRSLSFHVREDVAPLKFISRGRGRD